MERAGPERAARELRRPVRAHGALLADQRTGPGVPMPGQYLATMDFADATSGNYDYQDNFYLVTNVVPAASRPDAVAPTLTYPSSGRPASAAWTSTPTWSRVLRADPPGLARRRRTFTLPRPPAAPGRRDGHPEPRRHGRHARPGRRADRGHRVHGDGHDRRVDVAGNALAAAETWSFTTAGTPPGRPAPRRPPARRPSAGRPAAHGSAADGPAADADHPEADHPDAAAGAGRPHADAERPRAEAGRPGAERPDPAHPNRQERATGPTAQAKAFCARSPRLSAGLTRQMAAAKRLRRAGDHRRRPRGGGPADRGDRQEAADGRRGVQAIRLQGDRDGRILQGLPHADRLAGQAGRGGPGGLASRRSPRSRGRPRPRGWPR